MAAESNEERIMSKVSQVEKAMSHLLMGRG